jgi:hypothetical protein
VGDEDAVNVGEPDRTHELALSPLAAVEQQPIAAAADQDRGQAASGTGHGAAGTGEEQGKVHEGYGSVEGPNVVRWGRVFGAP